MTIKSTMREFTAEEFDDVAESHLMDRLDEGWTLAAGIDDLLSHYRITPESAAEARERARRVGERLLQEKPQA
jgi:hypothetical protein